jgi:Xaa-Pro aminopeptidase
MAGYGELFRHRLGHGIGLDVHEPPFLTGSDQTPIIEGVLFTIEPSITSVEGFSARVEDVVLATQDGGMPLSDRFRSLHVVG